jgi:hypothetical protein
MRAMTVPERICHFLIQRSGRRYCDTCIQERLGLKWRQQVQLITATLAVTAAFTREVHACCTCNETKQVTSAVNGQVRNKLQKPDALDRREKTKLDASAASLLKARVIANRSGDWQGSPPSLVGVSDRPKSGVSPTGRRQTDASS